MSRTSRQSVIAGCIILGVLLADQVLKLWVKTSFFPGEELYITSWFRLHFLENDGMAFGLELGSKLYLTLFRIIVSAAVLGYLIWSIRKKEPDDMLVVSLSLIFAGAFGNIIDCVFYGVIFDYAPLFEGRVVDMLYFPLIEGHYWDWLPGVGGEPFVFFAPVFNLADSAICIGVALILIFERRIFK